MINTKSNCVALFLAARVLAQNPQAGPNPTVRVPDDLPAAGVPTIIGIAESRTTYRLKSLTGSDAEFANYIFTDGPVGSFAWQRQVIGPLTEQPSVTVTVTEKAACAVVETSLAKSCSYTYAAAAGSPPEVTPYLKNIEQNRNTHDPEDPEVFTLVYKPVTATGKAVNTDEISSSSSAASEASSSISAAAEESSSVSITSGESSNSSSSSASSSASSTSTRTSTVTAVAKTTSSTPSPSAKSGGNSDRLSMLFAPAFLALGGLLSL